MFIKTTQASQKDLIEIQIKAIFLFPFLFCTLKFNEDRNNEAIMKAKTWKLRLFSSQDLDRVVKNEPISNQSST